MRSAAALWFAVVLACLAAAGTARAGSGLVVGIDDDSIKWTARPGTMIGALASLKADAMRVTLRWRPGQRTLALRDQTQLRRATLAQRFGVRVVLGVYGQASETPLQSYRRDDYCAFVHDALVRFPQIKDVVIWNEVNSATFWQPQQGAPAAYEALLARCWDALHADIDGVNVLTTTAAAHDPAAFIRGIGAAYQASGRLRPIFDTLGHNPYPRFSDEAPAATHEAGYVGQGDYARLVGTLDAAFAETNQPPAPVWYLEDGFQTDSAARLNLYAGRENASRLVSPAGQASQLVSALRLAYCQPRVTGFFNFLLVDELPLSGWQSGLVWPDWTRKPSFDAYRSAIDDVHRGRVDCGASAVLPAAETPALARLLADATW